MGDTKRKGGAEKARIKKNKKALETDAAKCSKLCTLLLKKTNDDDEAGK